jgi:hypothetical protein
MVSGWRTKYYSVSTIDIPIANNSCLGLWQAYNTDQGVWGRLIYIAAGGEPVTPVNLQISYYDTNIILAWDQAPFATSYRLYASDEPESGSAFCWIISQILSQTTE